MARPILRQLLLLNAAIALLAFGSVGANTPAAAVGASANDGASLGWMGTAAKRQEFAAGANSATGSEPTRYQFKPAETARLINFLLTNLRPWKKRIPHELVDFMEVRLRQRNGAFEATDSDDDDDDGGGDNTNANGQTGENGAADAADGKSSKKHHWFFDFTHWLKSPIFNRGNSEEKRKRKEEGKRKREKEATAKHAAAVPANGDPNKCTACGNPLHGGKTEGLTKNRRKSTFRDIFFGGSKNKHSPAVPSLLGTVQEGEEVTAEQHVPSTASSAASKPDRMATVAFPNRAEGVKMLSDIAEPLNDLLASVIEEDAIEDVLALFEKEIAEGEKKGHYSSEAVKTLKELVTIFHERMEKRLVPTGTFRRYYAHTMLYQYFLTLFDNYVRGLEDKNGKQAEKSADDYGLHKFMVEQQPFALKDKIANNLDEIAWVKGRISQLKFLGSPMYKRSALDRLKALVEVTQEIGVNELCTYRSGEQTPANEQLLQLLESLAMCAEQMAASVENMPLIAASMQKLKEELLKYKQLRSAYLEEQQQQQQKEVATAAAVSSPVQTDCPTLLHDIELLQNVWQFTLDLLTKGNARVLGPLARMAYDVPTNLAVNLLLVSAFQALLEQHKVQRQYEESAHQAMSERIKAHRATLMAVPWYGVSGSVRKDKDNYQTFVGIVKEVRDVGRWIVQSESHRHLEKQKVAIQDKIDRLESAYSKYTSANTKQRFSTKGMTEFNGEIDAALKHVEQTMQQLIAGNPDKKEVEEFQAVIKQLANYRQTRADATAVYNKWMAQEEKNKWQGMMREAEQYGDWKVLQETLKTIQLLEANRQTQLQAYQDITNGMARITSMDGNKFAAILNDPQMELQQRLLHFKTLLEQVQKQNRDRLKPLARVVNSAKKREQLKAENEVIQQLVAKIDEYFVKEEEIAANKERAVALNLEAHDLDRERFDKLNGEIDSVKNYFMLQRLLNKQHMANIDAYNAQMVCLTTQNSQITLGLKLLKDGLGEKVQLLDILTENTQFDDDDEEPAFKLYQHYKPILEGMKRNQKKQRDVMYEFFLNEFEDTLAIISRAHIEPIKKNIFDTRFTLAESVAMIEWLSTEKFELDLVNNPTSVIDLLNAKLTEVMGTVQQHVPAREERDYLSDFARNPMANKDPEEYYRQQIVNRNTKELPARKLSLLQRPLRAAILTLISMNERLVEMAKSAERPTQFYHQIAFVDIPIKLYIPLAPQDSLSRGKFLLYTLFTFGESLVEQFKSEQLAINRLLTIGQDQMKDMHNELRAQKLVKNAFKIPFVPFRVEQFERTFVENFVVQVFERYGFNEQISSGDDAAAAENDGELVLWNNAAVAAATSALAPTKLGSMLLDEWNNDFKRQIRQEMCHFVGITFDEKAEEANIKLLDNTIKALHAFQSRLVKPLWVRPLNEQVEKRRAKPFRKGIQLFAMRFISGEPLLHQSRVAQSIWRDYRKNDPEHGLFYTLDPIDSEFAEDVLNQLIKMFSVRVSAKQIDKFAKKYIIYPYQTKKKGLTTVINLKELLKLNKKRVNSAVTDDDDDNNNDDDDGTELLKKVTQMVEQQQQKRRRKRAAPPPPPPPPAPPAPAPPPPPPAFQKAVLPPKPAAAAVENAADANGTEEIPLIPYDVEEFFDPKQLDALRDDPEQDPALQKIPPMAKPMYRLLRSLMMDRQKKEKTENGRRKTELKKKETATFNWELPNNSMLLEPMLKPGLFPDAEDFDLYLKPNVDFRLLTDPLDQFCFIIAHSKQNVHMRIKVQYYEHAAFRTLIEMENNLHAYSRAVDMLKQYEPALKQFLYRLTDYTNYVNQFVERNSHAYGFTLKSLKNFLLRNKQLEGGVIYRVADLIVEDFAAQGQLDALDQLVWMMEKMKKPLATNTMIRKLDSQERARLEPPKEAAISKKKGPKPAKKQAAEEQPTTALAAAAPLANEEQTEDNDEEEKGSNENAEENAEGNAEGEAKKIKAHPLEHVKLTKLKDIRDSIQDILQLRLKLLTEILENTRDDEPDEGTAAPAPKNPKKSTQFTDAMANSQFLADMANIKQVKNAAQPTARRLSLKKTQAKKDWRLTKSEAQKHRDILMNAYKTRFHRLIRRLNNIANYEKRLRDFYCFNACYTDPKKIAEGFDLTVMIEEFHSSFTLIKNSLRTYREKVKREEAAARRRAQLEQNKIFGKIVNVAQQKPMSSKEYKEMLANRIHGLKPVAQNDEAAGAQ